VPIATINGRQAKSFSELQNYVDQFNEMRSLPGHC